MRYTSSVFNPDGRLCNNDTNVPQFANSTSRSKSSTYRLQLFRELVEEGYLLFRSWGPAKNQRCYHIPGMRDAEGRKVRMTPEYAYTLHCKGMVVDWVKKESVERTLTLKGRQFRCLKCV